MSAVTAVVIGVRAAPPPPGAAEVTSVRSIEEIADAVRSSSVELIWLLDAGAVPGPATLEALIAAATTPAASLPVGRDGHPVETLMGGFADRDTAVLLDGVATHRIPLRHVPVVSLLVTREQVLDLAPPDEDTFGAYAGVEWTARLFARHGGSMIPASTVAVTDPGSPPAPRVAIRLVRSGAWRRTDAARPLRLAVNRLAQRRFPT